MVSKFDIDNPERNGGNEDSSEIISASWKVNLYLELNERWRFVEVSDLFFFLAKKKKKNFFTLVIYDEYLGEFSKKV